jgi:hypothetical protein
MSASTLSRIPTGTLLRFARDTPYQRTAVVLKDESILQVKNLEDHRQARQHFNSVEDWLLNIEDNTRCEYLDQTLNVENLSQKIDEYVSLDAYEDDCDSCSDSEADSECSWDSEAEDDEEDDAISEDENLDYNRNTRTRSAKNSERKVVEVRPVSGGRSAPQIRRSGRLANKPRVDYCEIADEFPNAYIGKARVEEVRAAKANTQNIRKANHNANSPVNRWFDLVKIVREEMTANGTYTGYKALMEEAASRFKAAHTNTNTKTSTNTQNPFMRVYTEVLREARASGKKIDFQAIAHEARSRYDASKKRA